MTSYFRFASTVIIVGILCSNRVVVSQDAFNLQLVSDQLAARVLAEAQVRRMDVESSIKIADATTKWLDVDLKKAEAFWKKRLSVRSLKLEDEQQKRAVAAKRQLLKQATTWNQLKNHPEAQGPNIRNGNALNFLLARLDTNMLAYGYALENNSDAQGILNKTRITPEMLGAINFRQLQQNGTVVFRADGHGLELNWWPFLLRVEDLRSERESVEDANRAIEQEAAEKQSVSTETVARLSESLAKLTNAFHRRYALDEMRRQDTQVVLQYAAAERFLKSKKSEWFRMPETVTGQRPGFDPKEGDHLLALLTFMSRNGLDFAPPAPGNEHVYQQLYHMMRDLYATDSLASELEKKIELKE